MAPGRNSDRRLPSHHPDEANFSCTLDDALWMSRKILALSRQDFAEIVEGASYPQPVGAPSWKSSSPAAIDRGRPNLSSPPLPFEAKGDLAPDLRGRQDPARRLAGYASRFAWGDPDSPLHGLQWYVLSEVQSNVMETLLSKANAELRSSVSPARRRLTKKAAARIQRLL